MENLSSFSSSNIIIKQSLSKIPELYQVKISQIVDIVISVAKDKIAFIILYGPLVSSDLVYNDSESYYPASSYNFLIVIKDKKYAANNIARKLEEKITNKINSRISDKLYPVDFIIESVDEINSATSEKKYFFTDIKKNGVLLYSSKEFELLKIVELDFKERVRVTRIDYQELTSKSKRFIRYCELSFEEGDLKSAAFNIYQAVEALFNCVCLVFNGHKSRGHDLEKLIKICVVKCNQLLTVFPIIISKKRESFHLISKAYIQARYCQQYKISKSDLEYLIDRTKVLMQFVIIECNKEIERIESVSGLTNKNRQF